MESVACNTMGYMMCPWTIAHPLWKLEPLSLQSPELEGRVTEIPILGSESVGKWSYSCSHPLGF